MAVGGHRDAEEEAGRGGDGLRRDREGEQAGKREERGGQEKRRGREERRKEEERGERGEERRGEGGGGRRGRTRVRVLTYFPLLVL